MAGSHRNGSSGRNTYRELRQLRSRTEPGVRLRHDPRLGIAICARYRRNPGDGEPSGVSEGGLDLASAVDGVAVIIGYLRAGWGPGGPGHRGSQRLSRGSTSPSAAVTPCHDQPETGAVTPTHKWPQTDSGRSQDGSGCMIIQVWIGQCGSGCSQARRIRTVSSPLTGMRRETGCADGDARERPVFPARSAGLPGGRLGRRRRSGPVRSGVCACGAAGPAGSPCRSPGRRAARPPVPGGQGASRWLWPGGQRGLSAAAPGARRRHRGHRRLAACPETWPPVPPASAAARRRRPGASLPGPGAVPHPALVRTPCPG